MRIRTIKPAFWANEKMSAMPDFTRLLALGLLNYADDHGYFWANPLMIRGALFPFDEDSSKVRRGLAQLASEGYLRLGKTGDGREAGHIVNFSKHQRVDKATPSDIQPLLLFDESSKNVLGLFDDQSTLDRKGKERIGKDILPEAAKPRERNEAFDALCVFERIPLDQINPRAAARIATALKEIKTVSPDVTAEEIARRGRNYHTHITSGAATAMALAARWGQCFEAAPLRSAPKIPIMR